jgi:hypothetical protein
MAESGAPAASPPPYPPLSGDAFVDQGLAVGDEHFDLALNSTRNLSHFAELLVEIIGNGPMHFTQLPATDCTWCASRTQYVVVKPASVDLSA